MHKLVILFSAAAAALFCDWLHLPAPWFFGPLVVAAFFSLRGWSSFAVTRKKSVAAQAVIGTTMGASFSPSTLRAIPEHFFVIGFAIVSILLVCLLNGWLLTRWTKLDPATAFLGTLPGGAGEMVALSDSLGADTRIVVVMQYARLLMILLALFITTACLKHGHSGGSPLVQEAPSGLTLLQVGLMSLLTLAGFIAGTRTKIPAGAFLVPSLLYLGAVFAGFQLGRWPIWVIALAYMVMALRIGAQFNPSTVGAIRALLKPLVGTSFVLLLAAFGLAQWFAFEMRLDLASSYLAAAPGGLDSVAAVAAEFQADSAVILTIHFARLMSVLLIGPWIVMGGSRWLRSGQQAQTVPP
jgi:uncharacterized protein